MKDIRTSTTSTGKTCGCLKSLIKIGNLSIALTRNLLTHYIVRVDYRYVSSNPCSQFISSKATNSTPQSFSYKILLKPCTVFHANEVLKFYSVSTKPLMHFGNERGTRDTHDKLAKWVCRQRGTLNTQQK